MSKKNWQHFRFVILIIIALLVLFPIFYLFLTSIKPKELLFEIPPRFYFKPTFQKYTDLFLKDKYYLYYYNSFVVASISTLFAVTLGALSSFAFISFDFWGKKFWFYLILFTRLYPPVTTLIPVFFIISRLGLLDTKLSLILLYTAFQVPLSMWIMKSFFLGIPKEIKESAILDGCSVGKLFYKIMLPLAKPGLVASGILIFVFNWNEFLFALILTSNNAKTAPVALMSFLESEGMVQWGSASVLGFSTIFPILIIIIFLNRYLIKGLLAGGVKG